MRFVLCDEDHLFTSMMEAMLGDLGHEVVGLATATADAVRLVETARPDVVIVDLSLGFNTDFDVIESALAVDATTIVFSYNANDAILSRYATRPLVVHKPDLTELERVVARLQLDSDRGVVEHDRRERPGRAASGPQPTGLEDAQAFYEAMNDAVAGDALVSIELPDGAGPAGDAADTAVRVREVMRDTDRLLVSGGAVRVFLPAGGEDGIASFQARVDAAAAVPHEATIKSVVVADDEPPAVAFDRLKHA
jgi:hypothetical protein